jgi:hypothetical protein
MRRMHRIVLLAGLLAIAPVLAGCEDFDIDKFDVFGINQKKKLPGDRKELFPQGVPGVTQGIPPEYLKENQPPPETAQAPAAQPADAAAPAPASKTAAIAPAEEPKSKPKRKPKPRTAARPATQITVQPTGQSQDQQQPLPPWPGQQAPQQGQPPASGQSSSTDPWPASPPPGTFSR